MKTATSSVYTFSWLLVLTISWINGAIFLLGCITLNVMLFLSAVTHRVNLNFITPPCLCFVYSRLHWHFSCTSFLYCIIVININLEYRRQIEHFYSSSGYFFYLASNQTQGVSPYIKMRPAVAGGEGRGKVTSIEAKAAAAGWCKQWAVTMTKEVIVAENIETLTVWLSSFVSKITVSTKLGFAVSLQNITLGNI